MERFMKTFLKHSVTAVATLAVSAALVYLAIQQEWIFLLTKGQASELVQLIVGQQEKIQEIFSAYMSCKQGA